MKVLLAIDGSPESHAAVREVAERPWPPGSVVRVLSVVGEVYPAVALSAPEVGFAPAATGALLEAQQTLREQAQALVARVAGELAQRGLQVEAHTRDGEPARAIVEEARTWGAHLIVVGSHGRHGLQRLLMGSVAQSVVSHAPCSVEVVHHEPAEGEGAAPHS